MYKVYKAKLKDEQSKYSRSDSLRSVLTGFLTLVFLLIDLEIQRKGTEGDRDAGRVREKERDNEA